MTPFALRFVFASALGLAAAVPAQAQTGVVNALCSTDASWCEMAATEFTRATGIKVNQAHKGTGEIGAQLRAEAANPKTDIWWGGTRDPFLQVKGARNRDNAKRYYDWLMSPAGQAIGGKAGSLQAPANKMFKPDPRIPSMDGVRLVKYDFEKYGKAAERRRLIERWTREVEALPR